ncbi:hypothetical protein GCM10027275_37010 [Rhabdobacter roseus]|uniref:Uncharacterized protein n=1 Tax=Rhabdobacter roseus TaxID=1655419 RepID=A0A840TWD7_9BACT|nr:hypothetical protein [Rhabdobacter roseus]MBB5285892.1 hypothetical protein [Rhabdobacter roseus]
MKNHSLLATLVLAFLSSWSFALPTRVVVRAKAKDAKFIGTGIGGAYVVIRHTLSGEILAKGTTTGASGNTELIMKLPHQRNARLTDDQTARFEVTLELQEPTFVSVEVTAPVSRKSAAITTSTQLWLIPGKDIDGDGLIVEIPGFILDILEPQTHQVIGGNTLINGKLKIRINLVMMCGCVINKGGIWDSTPIQVAALVKKDGKPLPPINLAFTGEDNLFEGFLSTKEKGNYEIQVYAFDTVTKNTGVDKINFVVQ